MRSYDESVEVTEGREGPERFRWRGRLLLVDEVLSRWVETGAWWNAPAVRAVRGDDELVQQRGRTTDRGRTHEGRAPATLTAEKRGRRGVFGGLPPAAVSDVWQTATDEAERRRARSVQVVPDEEVDLLAEHELWRVVARPAAGLPADEAGGVYELDRSWGTGAWRLRTVLD